MRQKKEEHIRKTVRFVALETLIEVKQKKAYSNLLLDSKIKQSQFSKKDSGLLTELVYGTISREMTLTYYLAPFIHSAKRVDKWVHLLLQLSIYQMLYLDKVPPHAVLNEAVEIAKVKGSIGISKFVNGVLRNIQRRGVAEVNSITDSVKRLAVEISLPEWLVEKLLTQMNYDELREMGLSLLTPSRASGRIQTTRISREEALAQLIEEHIEGEASKISPVGVVSLKGYLAGSSLFEEGKLTVQDESSMLVAPAMQIEEGHKVLDACAAPGGKTTHIATFLDKEKEGKVVALDLHEHKIRLIQDNAARLGVADVVEARQLDARQIDLEYTDAFFDRILVDAPCSGLGLMRRKPDIKYQKNLKDLARLPDIQFALLESVAPKLKKEGILTYSTCTFIAEENQGVIDRFLAKHPEFISIPIVGREKVAKALNKNSLTLYPHQYMTDGFFISCMKRIRW